MLMLGDISSIFWVFGMTQPGIEPNWVQTNDLCKIELFEIELFGHSTVYKVVVELLAI